MKFKVLLVLLSFSMCIFSSKTDNDFTLKVIHFNDFHARFEQTDPDSNPCTDENNCIGGFPRLFTIINKLKTEHQDSVVLNAGDSFQGSLYYNIFKWNITQQFMNLLPLDAHALGNHEFDDGVPGMTPYLKTLKAPMLIANIDSVDEPEVENSYKKSIIIKRLGRKIGIIGLITAETKNLANTGKLIFLDEVETVRTESKKLNDQGVDVIIVLSHCGLDMDKKIAAEAGDHIDLIVGGHSHTLLYNGIPPNGDKAEDVYPIAISHPLGHKILIVQAGAYNKYVGNLTIDFDSDGKVKKFDGQPIFLQNSIKQDEKMLEELKPFKKIVDDEGSKVVGHTKVDLTQKDCSEGECNLGSFICDAYLSYLVDKSPEGSWTFASAILMHHTSIKKSWNVGNITYLDFITGLPFDGTVNTFKIKGEHLLEALEYATSGENGLSYMIQTSGLKIIANLLNPIGKRIISAKIRCDQCKVPTYANIDKNLNYTIAANNFIANGGDGFVMVLNNKFDEKVWGSDRDMVLEYMKKMSPIYQEIGDRFILIK